MLHNITVTQDIFKKRTLFNAEQDSELPLRIAFIGLQAVCDETGKFLWEPEKIKGDVLPKDNLDFSDVLSALILTGLVKRLEQDGKQYGVIPSFIGE